MRELLWDGITRSKTLNATAVQDRQAVIDAAKKRDWSGLLEILARDRRLANAVRPDGNALYENELPLEVTAIQFERGMSLPNFRYAAHLYINDWLAWDKRFHDCLCPEADVVNDLAAGAKTMVEVATYYSVARTLPRIEDQEEYRLGTAYKELRAIEYIPDGEVANTVCTYAEKLKCVYGHTALSAASKFLWMRFRDPIIIYDSITLQWLHSNKEFDKKKCEYAPFLDAWLAAYAKVEGGIREACCDLRGIKRFILREVSDDELFACTSSSWFMKRVFDYSMTYAPEDHAF